MKSVLVPLLCLLGVLAGSPVRAADRPNFLFIYTDDQRHDEFGWFGWVRLGRT